MDVLFIHPNFPGQFLRLAERLSREPGYRVVTLGDESWTAQATPIAGAERLTYASPEPAGKETHPYVKGFEAAVRRGQQVVRMLLKRKHQGFEPDVIYIHPGWGDGLYLKEVFPDATIIGLFEYYYHARGADVGFDPGSPLSFNDLFRVRTMNTVQLHALESTDIRISPTAWQRSRYPKVYQAAIECLHEGIDTVRVQPDAAAVFNLPNGKTLKAGDELLTYVSRGLEPYRGFHCFMRALPAIMRNRPACEVVIVGGDKSHYGAAPAEASSWRQLYLDELGSELDLERVHFTGMLGYADYLSLLQVSRAHVYLSYPFILSWSMLEAMAAGALVIASATPPVQEFIRDRENGLLFPFFDTDALVSLATEALAEPQRFALLSQVARADIQQGYDFNDCIYPRHLAMLSGLKNH